MIGRERTGTFSANHMRAFNHSFSKVETGFKAVKSHTNHPNEFVKYIRVYKPSCGGCVIPINNMMWMWSPVQPPLPSMRPPVHTSLPSI